MKRIVHVVGTGTIGEPLIGLFTDFGDKMGVDEVTFHKRTPLLSDRAKLEHLMARGARLAVDADRKAAFEKLGHRVSFEAEEALERASVVIDCTPAGSENKERFYGRMNGPVGFLAQGSEFGFGKPYARGVNDDTLGEEDRFIQVVSCNTHSIATLIKTLAFESDGSCPFERGQFVCIRRANDVSQPEKFIPAPMVGNHADAQFGTHHARDAHHLFKTLGVDLDLFSSALKVNSQYMHSVWFSLTLGRATSLEEVIDRLKSNPLVAVTEKNLANLIFSFGRDHGYYGRILSQIVVVEPTVTVRGDREVVGFCFTPQDGNSLLSSVAATLYRMDPDWEHVARRLEPLQRWLYREI